MDAYQLDLFVEIMYIFVTFATIVLTLIWNATSHKQFIHKFLWFLAICIVAVTQMASKTIYLSTKFTFYFSLAYDRCYFWTLGIKCVFSQTISCKKAAEMYLNTNHNNTTDWQYLGCLRLEDPAFQALSMFYGVILS